MLRTALRNLFSHKLRLALSGLAVVLGVAFVSGTMIFTDTLQRTFTDLFAGTSADVTVEPKAAFETGMTGTGVGGPANTVPESVVSDVASLDGVEAAEGYVQSEGVYILDEDGKVLKTGGAPGVGVSWSDEKSLRSGTLTDGRAPSAADEIAIDTGSMEKLDYEVGDTISILTPGPRVEATLVGVFRFGEHGGLAGASLVAFETGTAQELLLEPGQFTAVGIEAEDGTTHADLRDAVAAKVGSSYDVKTRAEQADDLATSMEQELAFINTFLLAFAGVALFVGTFIILNTFSMLVAQRTRELALLRALGASRRQVTVSVMLEALVLGLVGSTTGLLAGYGLAHGLKALFGRIGLTLDGGLVFAADTVVWAYLVGVLVTVIAAFLPAWRASKVPPVAAMRAEVAHGSRSLRNRALGGAILAVAGGLALGLGAVNDDGSGATKLVGVGAVLLVVAAILLSPVLAIPFIRLVGGVLPRLAGKTGQLSRENALRNPRRTAATSSALMVGLGLVTGFSIIGASTNAAVDELVEGGVKADYVVSTAVAQPFTTEVADKINQVEGVSAVTQSRFGMAQIDGEVSYFTAVDADTFDENLHVDFVSGGLDGVREGFVVDDTTADSRAWKVGQDVDFLLPNGQRQNLRLGGIFEHNDGIGTLLVSMETYEAGGGPALDRFVYVHLDDSADADAVEDELTELVAAYPVVDLKDKEEFKDEQRAQVDQMLMLINALLVLSVIIAVIGVVNTLVLSVIERTRELGLLRAIGMTQRQIRRMVRLESVVISVYGAVLGIVLGTVLGVSLTGALEGEGIERSVVPWPVLGLFLVVGAVIGVAAAALPARRAGRLKVLEAIATE